MRIEIDYQTISPDEFATTVGRWIQLLEQADEAPPKLREVRTAARSALEQACAVDRQDLIQALADRDGIGAMKLAATEGVVRAIERLHAVGIDCDETKKSAVGITPLIFAAKHGHADAVLALLDRGADLAKHVVGLNALGVAIWKGHIETVWAILDRVDDLRGLEYMQGTLLECVAEHGGAEYVPAVVERGISPDATDNDRKPPIATAAKYGRADVILALLAAGASTELPPPEKKKRDNPFLVDLSEPPLLLAAKHGHDEAVRVLLDASADLDATDHLDMTAYNWARKNQHTEIADRLRRALGLSEGTFDGHDLIAAARVGDVATIERALAAGVDIEFCDEETADDDGNSIPGRTALMWATVEGHVEAVKVLLAAGSAPDKKEKKAFDRGVTAWELAAGHDRVEILRLFEENPADRKGMSEALVTAAREGKLHAVKQLVDSGVNVDARDAEHQTPLMAAASKGRAEVIKLLLDRSANVELRDKGMFASTALYLAVLGISFGESVKDEQGNSVVRRIGDPAESTRLLLEAGADVNSVAKHGDYALQHAAGHPELTRMLIDAGADLSLTDRVYGSTPLHWAVRGHDMQSIKMLLDAGAAPSPVDKEGRTPLDLARKDNLSEIANLLEDAGAVMGMETEDGRAAVDAKYAEELAERKRCKEAMAADEALQPDFRAAMESDNYKQAIERLEALTDVSHKSPENLPALAYCKVELQRAEELLNGERGRFAELGCTLLRCGNVFLADDDDQLGILPTTDPFEVIAAIGAAGPNCGVFMSEIVAELKRLYELAPFHLTQVRYDTIGLEFVKPIPKPKVRKWSVRLYELCPDLVDQGFMTITKLREHLTNEKALTLWWD